MNRRDASRRRAATIVKTRKEKSNGKTRRRFRKGISFVLRTHRSLRDRCPAIPRHSTLSEALGDFVRDPRKSTPPRQVPGNGNPLITSMISGGGGVTEPTSERKRDCSLPLFLSLSLSLLSPLTCTSVRACVRECARAGVSGRAREESIEEKEENATDEGKKRGVLRRNLDNGGMGGGG